MIHVKERRHAGPTHSGLTYRCQIHFYTVKERTAIQMEHCSFMPVDALIKADKPVQQIFLPGIQYQLITQTVRKIKSQDIHVGIHRGVTFSWLLKISISCSFDLVSFSTSSNWSRSCCRASSFASKALLRVRSESPILENDCKIGTASTDSNENVI